MATANEKAKAAHSQRDLKARVKCAKAVIKAKYEYRMAVQGARPERCTELEESEATYSEALSKNAAALSLQCTTLCREHMEHMWELEACTLRTENKSHRDFLIAHQAVLHQALQTLKDDSILPTPSYWDHLSQPVNPLQSPQHLRLEGNYSPLFLLSLNPNSLFPQKNDIHLLRHRWTCQWKRISPLCHRRNCRTLRKERQQTALPA